MRQITICLSDKEYEDLLHACEKARKSVKLPARTVQRALIDNVKLIEGLRRSGVVVKSEAITE